MCVGGGVSLLNSTSYSTFNHCFPSVVIFFSQVHCSVDEGLAILPVLLQSLELVSGQGGRGQLDQPAQHSGGQPAGRLHAHALPRVPVPDQASARTQAPHLLLLPRAAHGALLVCSATVLQGGRRSTERGRGRRRLPTTTTYKHTFKCSCTGHLFCFCISSKQEMCRLLRGGKKKVLQYNAMFNFTILH